MQVNIIFLIQFFDKELSTISTGGFTSQSFTTDYTSQDLVTQSTSQGLNAETTVQSLTTYSTSQSLIIDSTVQSLTTDSLVSTTISSGNSLKFSQNNFKSYLSILFCLKCNHFLR